MTRKQAQDRSPAQAEGLTANGAYNIFDEVIVDDYKAERLADTDPEVAAALVQVQRRKAVLAQDKTLRELTEKYERYKAAQVTRIMDLARIGRRVKRTFNANGLTPEVKKAVKELAVRANKTL